MILPFSTFTFGEKTDIFNHWMKDEAQYLMAKGVVAGYPDGSLRLDQSIGRAEFFKIINNVFGYSKKANIQFDDVKEQDWFYDEITY